MTGLQSAGFDVGAVGAPRARSDWLVIWNRMGSLEHRADEWERAGGTVIVVENGYIGADADGHQLYAIAVHGHNGSGWAPAAAGRLAGQRVDLAPWVHRPDGYVLLCGQRGIGSRQMASPRRWERQTVDTLTRMRVGPLRTRMHPGALGAAPPRTTLQQDLAGARVVVTWASSCGVHALAAGVPVVYCAPRWIAAGAAGRGLGAVHAPPADDASRAQAFDQVAAAQWSLQEITAGAPFAAILAQLEHAKW